MKELVAVCGPNGVGKSTLCGELLRRSPRSALVDSDACRAINPFVLTDVTRGLVLRNMADFIENFLSCPEIDRVFFSYGFHKGRWEMFRALLGLLKERGVLFALHPLLLTCGEEENIRRMQADGRAPDRIQRTLDDSRPLYAPLKQGEALSCRPWMAWPALDATGLSAAETAAAASAVIKASSPYDISQIGL